MRFKFFLFLSEVVSDNWFVLCSNNPAIKVSYSAVLFLPGAGPPTGPGSWRRRSSGRAWPSSTALSSTSLCPRSSPPFTQRVTDVQWIIESYALFLSSLLLVGGAAGDLFGRRRVYIAGIVLFTAASALCGLSTDIRALILARALQGIGGALLVPGSLAIISATFEEEDRGRAIGTWSGFTSITAAIGPGAGRVAR